MLYCDIIDHYCFSSSALDTGELIEASALNLITEGVHERDFCGLGRVSSASMV